MSKSLSSATERSLKTAASLILRLGTHIHCLKKQSLLLLFCHSFFIDWVSRELWRLSFWSLESYFLEAYTRRLFVLYCWLCFAYFIVFRCQFIIVEQLVSFDVAVEAELWCTRILVQRVWKGVLVAPERIQLHFFYLILLFNAFVLFFLRLFLNRLLGECQILGVLHSWIDWKLIAT